MALFRKKIDYEDFWVGMIGDLLTPDSEVWVVEVLFPEFKFTTVKNSPKTAVETKGFTANEFLAVKRALAVSAVASLASWAMPNQFSRFELTLGNPRFLSDLSQYFDARAFITGLVKALNVGDASNLADQTTAGSETYGRRETISGDQLQMYDTANISLSYLIGFFASHPSSIHAALIADPATSRDSLIDFFAYTVRFHNHLQKRFKPQ